MNDRLASLRRTLDELERRLDAAKLEDPATREAFAAARRELDAALVDDSDEPSDDAPDSLRERLGNFVEEFEASHPDLTNSVSRIVDLLGQVGI